MATDTSTMMENLLTAINIIAEKKVESLPYDKTLTCTIVNADNAAKGEYSVTDGTSTFLAYSDNTTYKVNTRIYVTVPNGDFNNKKIIKGKYVAGEEEPYYTYVSPLDNFLDITGNIYGYDDDNAITDKIGLIANAHTNSTHAERILIWSLGYTETTPTVGKHEEKLTELNLNQYTRLGIGGSFSTRLSGVITGHYGLFLDVITEIPQSDAIATEVSIQQILDGEYTLTKDLQQIVIDKAQELAGSSQSIEGYAAALDYLNKLPNSAAIDSFTIAARGQTKYKKYKYELDSQNMFGNPYRFILPSNQEVLFDISNIKNEPIVGLQMYFYEIPDSFRTMEGSLLPVAQYSNLFVQDIIVSFGYDVKEYTEDTVLCYTTAPLVYLSTSRTIEDINSLQLNKKKVQARWIHKQDNGRMYAIDQVDEIPTYQTDDTTDPVKMATIHWYQYQLDNPYAGDEIAGPQWAEITEWQDQFAVNFIPDYKKASERLKVIVEYPSIGYVNNVLNSSEALSRINDTIVIAQTEKQQLELSLAQLKVEDPNNSTEIQRLENEIEKKEYDIDIAIRQYDRVYNDIQASIGTKYYESEILVFFNESEVANQVNTDLVQGLAIECDVEDRKGEYYCYQQNTNQIINYGDAVKLRYLRARYNSILTFSDLDVPEIISWYIPLENTMIATPKEGVTYNQKDSEGNNLDSALVSAEEIVNSQSLYKNYFKITRQGPKITEQNTHSGTYIQAAAEQPFQIKDVYSATAKNNRIYCEVIRNNISYWGHVDLLFDYGALQGTKYTFILTPTNAEALTVEEEHVTSPREITRIRTESPTHTDTLTLRPFIYDYNHNDITDTLIDKITYSWYVQSPADGATTDISETRIRGINDDGYLTLQVNPAFNDTIIQNLFYYIVQAKVTSDFGSIDENSRSITLIARYPVAIRKYISSTEEYGNFNGNSLISYSNQGVNPIYYKDAFSLKKIGDKHIRPYNDVSWKVAVYDDFTNDGNPNPQTHFNYKSPYYPQFSSKNCLIVPNIFMNNASKRVSAVCFDSQNNNIIWIQPLIIEQYGYESEMLNVWNGSLTIDKNNDTILSAMIGAGIKTQENKFSGVLMGQISKVEQGNPDIGLYGYHEGSQSFGFKVDGTAFLGESGKGQIKFNGNKGTIFSASYDDKNGGTGVLLDLDGNEEQPGGIYTVKVNKKEIIKLQPYSPYFTIKTSDGKNILLNIADETDNTGYYLATSNFVDSENGNGQGIKIDLGQGLIKAYSGFRILAYKNKIAQQGWIDINSGASDYPLALGKTTATADATFKVNWDGVLYATGADIQGTIKLNSSSTYAGDDLSALKNGLKAGGWFMTANGLYHGTSSNITHYLGNPNNDIGVYTNATNSNVTKNLNLVFKAGDNFGVTTSGILFAKGARISGVLNVSAGSDVGGWTVSDEALFHYRGNNAVIRNATHYIGDDIVSNTFNPSDTSYTNVKINDAFTYTSNNQTIKLNSSQSAATIVMKIGSNFVVSSSGTLWATGVQITGNITATSGYIGNSASGWTIGNTSIYNGMTSLSDTSHNGVYIGTDGIALGKGVFKVTNAGVLTATNVTITGTITATGGEIGGIKIIDGSISTGIWNAISANVGTLIAKTVTADYIKGKHAVLGSLSVTNGAVYSASAFTSGTGFNAGSTGYVEAGSYKAGDKSGVSKTFSIAGVDLIKANSGIVTEVNSWSKEDFSAMVSACAPDMPTSGSFNYTSTGFYAYDSQTGGTRKYFSVAQALGTNSGIPVTVSLS